MLTIFITRGKLALFNVSLFLYHPFPCLQNESFKYLFFLNMNGTSTAVSNLAIFHSFSHLLEHNVSKFTEDVFIEGIDKNGGSALEGFSKQRLCGGALNSLQSLKTRAGRVLQATNMAGTDHWPQMQLWHSVCGATKHSIMVKKCNQAVCPLGRRLIGIYHLFMVCSCCPK